ncbi:MAG: hypothetical protein AAF702_12155 [Chloroflexota bacterium]
MFGTVILVGGAIGAGWGAYQYANKPSANRWWKQLWMQVRSVPLVKQLKPIHTIAPHITQIKPHGDLLMATALVSVIAVARTNVVPFRYIAAPMLLYRGFPAIQATVEAIQHERTTVVVLLETTALVIILAQGAWLSGSVGFALYHLMKWWLVQVKRGDLTESTSLFLIKRYDKETQVSLEHLRPGDWVSILASQEVPVDSRVTEGVAWVRHQLESGEQKFNTVKRGDLLTKDTLVLAGSLWLEVPIQDVTV